MLCFLLKAGCEEHQLNGHLLLEKRPRKDTFPGDPQESGSSLPAWQREKCPASLVQLKETIIVADPVAALIFVCIYRTEDTRLAS